MGDVVSYFHIFSVGADFMDNTQVEHPETGSLFNPILPKNSRFLMGDVGSFVSLSFWHGLRG